MLGFIFFSPIRTLLLPQISPHGIRNKNVLLSKSGNWHDFLYPQFSILFFSLSDRFCSLNTHTNEKSSILFGSNKCRDWDICNMAKLVGLYECVPSLIRRKEKLIILNIYIHCGFYTFTYIHIHGNWHDFLYPYFSILYFWQAGLSLQLGNTNTNGIKYDIGIRIHVSAYM